MLGEIAAGLTALGMRMLQYGFAITCCIPIWALIIAFNRKDFEEWLNKHK